jgi:deoxyribodipyrimidine photo-lyase
MNPVTRHNTSIVWFRTDLRLTDNPALYAAFQRGGPVLPLFIWCPEEEGEWPLGGASKWWLHQSLGALGQSLMSLGSPLVVRQGLALELLRQLVRETGATAVFWNRRYEPATIARDRGVKEGLRSLGIEAESFNGSLLREPWTVKTKTGGPYQVFTPFWRACRSELVPPAELPPPASLVPLDRPVQSLMISDLGLEPTLGWAAGFTRVWSPGERGAQALLNQFLGQREGSYAHDRDRPDREGTSRLSPHLHFGEISPRQIWHATAARAAASVTSPTQWQESRFLTEVGWREFAFHLLYHFPDTPLAPLRQEFSRFPWRPDAAALRAWQRGQTGYPLVDAGMRQLWTTGWMHNRVRMVVASFLVKHLLLPWQDGARWFWDTLVDADLASNTLGWQWTAGCGADAAPFFRIFNPVSQGEKFDPEGNYVRTWVPELGRLPARWIHQPWTAPAAELRDLGVVLGKTYPRPMVEHATARADALAAYAATRSGD